MPTSQHNHLLVTIRQAVLGQLLLLGSRYTAFCVKAGRIPAFFRATLAGAATKMLSALGKNDALHGDLVATL
jgi:hypothetical protein